MTVYELVERDFERAHRNLLRARQKPNVTKEEIKNLEEIREARDIILNIIGQTYKE